MDEIVISKKELPSDVSELSRFVLIGRDALAAVRAQIRASGRWILIAERGEEKGESKTE